MAARAAWPSVSCGVAFTAGTFTETTLGQTTGALLAFECSRGRQYELGRTEAGTGSFVFDNHDARYVPGNTSSPTPVSLLCEAKVTATWSGTTYPVVRGFIERWPVGYAKGGAYPTTSATFTDAAAILAGQTLKSVADYEVLADSPLYLYKLDESSSSTTAGDSVSPGTNPLAVVKNGPGGAGSVAFGGTTALVEGSTGATFGGTSSGVSSTAPVSVLSISSGGSGPVVSGSAFTLEAWVQTSTPPVSGTVGIVNRLATDPANANVIAPLEMSLRVRPDGTAQFSITGGTQALSPTSSASVCDGKLHHLVAVLSGGGYTATLFVDGAQVATATLGSGAAFNPTTLQTNQIGGLISQISTGGDQFLGTIARVAAYNTSLSAARILAHYNAGANGFSGEDGGARITRLLGYAKWPTSLSDIGTGASAMGPAVVAGTSVLEAIEDVADSELGNLWISAAGKVTFRSRVVRQTTTSSSVVFGELESSGEYPYLDSVAFDYDPTYVITSQKVTRVGGASTTATASSPALPYPKSGTDREVNITSDVEAVDQATWLVAQLGKARVRVASLTIEPSSNTNLWPVALGTEINTRVTVNRRAPGLPTLSVDCWVEAISHHVTPTSWQTTYLLSPCDSPRAALWDVDNWDDTNAVWAF